MGSAVEQKIEEAKKELEQNKARKGVQVNTPEKSIVRKAVSSIDEDMEAPEPRSAEENDPVEELESIKSSIDSGSETAGDHGHSLIGKIRSVFSSHENVSEDFDAVSELHKMEKTLENELEEMEANEEELDHSLPDSSMNKLEDLENELDSLEGTQDDSVEVQGESPPAEVESVHEEPKVGDKELENDMAQFEEHEKNPESFGAGEQGNQQIESEPEKAFQDGDDLKQDLDRLKNKVESASEEDLDDGLQEERQDNKFDDVEQDMAVQDLDSVNDNKENTDNERKLPQESIGVSKTGNLEPLENEEGRERKHRNNFGDPEAGVEEESRMQQKKDALEENLNYLEEMIADEEAQDEDIAERVTRLEDEIEKIGEQHEVLERIADIEEKIGDMGKRDKRMLRLEQRIEELENQRQNDLKEIRKESQKSVDEFREVVEAELERIGQRQEEIASSVKELRNEFEVIDDPEDLDAKIERLWEGMDRELESVESRIYENEAEFDDLMSTMVELSELVKKSMNR